MNNNFKKGFTIIELLVVIAIVGVLFSMLNVYMNKAREKARFASALNFSNNVQNSLVHNSEGAWKLNELSSDFRGPVVFDMSRNENDGIVSGTELVDAPSQLGGKALSFDGTGGDFIHINEDPEFPESLIIREDITVEAWVKPSSYGNQMIVGPIDNIDCQYGLFQQGNEFGFAMNDGNDSYKIIFGKFNVGSWYYVVGTFNYDNRSIKGYVDGKEADISNTDTRGAGAVCAFDDIYIGHGDSSFGYYEGLINDVRIHRASIID